MESQIIYLNQSSPVRQHEYLVMIKALTAFNYFMFKNDNEIYPIEDIEELTEKILEHKFNDLAYFKIDAYGIKMLASSIDFIPEEEMKGQWNEILDNAVREDYFMKVSA